MLVMAMVVELSVAEEEAERMVDEIVLVFAAVV